MTYTIKELSSELNVSEKTCLRWIASGLKIIAGSKKPILIMGHEAKEFLRKKDSKRKVKLERNEFYCFTCKAPRRAKRGSLKKLKNNKTGLCHVCNGKMCKTFEPYQKDYQISLFPT